MSSKPISKENKRLLKAYSGRNQSLDTIQLKVDWTNIKLMCLSRGISLYSALNKTGNPGAYFKLRNGYQERLRWDNLGALADVLKTEPVFLIDEAYYFNRASNALAGYRLVCGAIRKGWTSLEPFAEKYPGYRQHIRNLLCTRKAFSGLPLFVVKHLAELVGMRMCDLFVPAQRLRDNSALATISNSLALLDDVDVALAAGVAYALLTTRDQGKLEADVSNLLLKRNEYKERFKAKKGGDVDHANQPTTS